MVFCSWNLVFIVNEKINCNKFTISTDAAFIVSDMFTRWQLELDKFQVFHFVVTFMCVQLINTAIDFSTTTVIWIHLYLFKQA